MAHYDFPWLHLTTPEENGVHVQEAQYLLTHNRWGKNFEPGPIDNWFGPATAAACKRAKYYLGYAVPDGSFGYLLYGFLVPAGHAGFTRLGATYAYRKALRARHATAETIRDKSVHTAMSQVGYSPGACSKYGYWYAPGFGCSNWCAMFISWCFHQNGGAFRYAYVPAIVSDARMHQNNLAAVSEPITGDLACYDWQGDGVADHVEFFRGWSNAEHSLFAAVGGNTGAVNMSAGGEVLAQERSASVVQQFVRVYST